MFDILFQNPLAHLNLHVEMVVKHRVWQQYAIAQEEGTWPSKISPSMLYNKIYQAHRLINYFVLSPICLLNTKYHYIILAIAWLVKKIAVITFQNIFQMSIYILLNLNKCFLWIFIWISYLHNYHTCLSPLTNFDLHLPIPSEIFDLSSLSTTTVSI